MQLRAAFWLCSPGLAIRWARGRITRKGVAVPVPRAPDPPPGGRPRVPLGAPTRDFSPDTSPHEELASENALPRAQVALLESKIADVERSSRPTSPRGSIPGTRAPSPLPGKWHRAGSDRVGDARALPFSTGDFYVERATVFDRCLHIWSAWSSRHAQVRSWFWCLSA